MLAVHDLTQIEEILVAVKAAFSPATCGGRVNWNLFNEHNPTLDGTTRKWIEIRRRHPIIKNKWSSFVTEAKEKLPQVNQQLSDYLFKIAVFHYRPYPNDIRWPTITPLIRKEKLHGFTSSFTKIFNRQCRKDRSLKQRWKDYVTANPGPTDEDLYALAIKHRYPHSRLVHWAAVPETTVVKYFGTGSTRVYRKFFAQAWNRLTSRNRSFKKRWLAATVIDKKLRHAVWRLKNKKRIYEHARMWRHKNKKRIDERRQRLRAARKVIHKGTRVAAVYVMENVLDHIRRLYPGRYIGQTSVPRGGHRKSIGTTTVMEDALRAVSVRGGKHLRESSSRFDRMITGQPGWKATLLEFIYGAADAVKEWSDRKEREMIWDHEDSGKLLYNTIRYVADREAPE
eukprot:gnl/Dysnectes_brevis/4193_a5539_470.p1 GENE.gnl/Dysnectes_brevis/4193_a5539_470~~gnl/Dysnectes_brevis/4193_a5539_470.p1  ORF type:complete len:397 (-),score=40.97 gnl/Dysnectes_brevis/4193_a5539_470:21-1211(-)